MHRIAVLDDDENWCFTIQRFFRKYYQVSVFADVEIFLGQVDRFDLAIVDFSLPRAVFEPKTNGSEIIRNIKSKLKNPPILVLASGFISTRDQQAGYEICPEADSFLAKDAGLDNILQHIHFLLAEKKPSSFVLQD
ncbi:response regulator [Ancylothrix sp. C2]|uniref:response regulator n=1 Tax=Ancylothrix sp. D3o TaxID=2953691 RepID=UPI0021BB6DA3|nr:response regulator [Ancylothrix sp. D3o]MCT7950169.1 response regulator [Ancylothrix sp. D3o]